MKGLWGQERAARAGVPAPYPRARSPGISLSKEQGSDAAAREQDPGVGEGGRGGEEGRGEGAWPARSGRALGGGAAARRSLLWGPGFAALSALGREQERGTELRSQRSHRDERRSRRLGFPLRPGAPAPRPDRWEGAAGTRTASPGSPCARLGPEHVGVCRERWLPALWCRGISASGKIRGGPGTLLRPALLTCAGSPRVPGGGRAERGVFREWGRRGGLRLSEVRLRAAGCVRVWGCFCAEGERAQRWAARWFACSALISAGRGATAASFC